jgi:hypothetical protein
MLLLLYATPNPLTRQQRKRIPGCHLGWMDSVAGSAESRQHHKISDTLLRSLLSLRLTFLRLETSLRKKAARPRSNFWKTLTFFRSDRRPENPWICTTQGGSNESTMYMLKYCFVNHTACCASMPRETWNLEAKADLSCISLSLLDLA